ncbi:hypothetical protein G5C51_22140 [Streptomyces sp. A7024]|uniref:Uncharacterized protein n=1 Tax=Streptomyces coryli TaxID=1128680 RepID=A0A6G4U4C2_9ACTN|nr:hypothetical protein [Streptomyces coryli]NGN66590.1 hypothetical protein [Streptomyces coryli]
MSIEWAALGEVFGVSLVVTVGIVGVFTLGIVGTARRTAPAGEGDGESVAPTGAARAGATVCFAACAAAVAYGIYLIVA